MDAYGLQARFAVVASIAAQAGAADGGRQGGAPSNLPRFAPGAGAVTARNP